MNELRPSIKRGHLVVGGVIALLVVGALFGVPRYLRWSEHRQFEAREAAQAPYDNEFKRLAPTLHDRLAPLATVAPTTGPCPPEVRGTLPLVQQAWLPVAVGDAHDRPSGPQAMSPAFHYMVGDWTPSFGDTDQLAKRNAALAELAASAYVVVFATAQSDAIKETGEHTFAGGSITGTLLVVDVVARKALCGAEMTSQPDFVIGLRQSSPQGDRWAMDHAKAEAVHDAFWKTATTELATMAPAAKLVSDQRY